MTNYELHKEEFEKLLLENGVVFFSVVGDTVQVCGSTDCHDCLFDNSESCSKARIEWLNKEHEEPIVITAENLYSSFRKFCDEKNNCEACDLWKEDCKFTWLLENYNVTKKSKWR